MATHRSSLAGLALGAMSLVFLACDGWPTDPDGSIGFQTVFEATVVGSQPNRQEVIRDQAAWQAVWDDLFSHQTPPPLPAIDFSREMVVLVTGPGCCGHAEILSIDLERSALEVNADLQSSSALCVQADFSVHAVRLTRFTGPVRFDVRRGEKAC